jgi:small membrane protein
MIIQIITIIVVLFLLWRVAIKLKRKEITLKEAGYWGIFWFLVGVVVLYPKIVDKIAEFVGLQTATGIDLVVYIAVGLAFYLIFRMFVRMEKIDKDITKIVRHIALKDKNE